MCEKDGTITNRNFHLSVCWCARVNTRNWCAWKCDIDLCVSVCLGKHFPRMYVCCVSHNDSLLTRSANALKIKYTNANGEKLKKIVYCFWVHLRDSKRVLWARRIYLCVSFSVIFFSLLCKREFLCECVWGHYIAHIQNTSKCEIFFQNRIARWMGQSCQSVYNKLHTSRAGWEIFQSRIGIQ